MLTVPMTYDEIQDPEVLLEPVTDEQRPLVHQVTQADVGVLERGQVFGG